jgi:hypothetical protein
MFVRLSVLGLTIAAFALAGAAADLHDGTWMVNTSKSKYTTHPPKVGGWRDY